MGFGAASLSGILSSSLIGRWFPANRLGVPLAVSWSASGVGAMATFPAAQYLIATDGWRHAYLVFSGVSAVFIPLLLVLPWKTIERGAPGLARLRETAAPGVTVREALRDWPFWALTSSFALTSIGIFALMPQTMVYLLERGMEGPYAARAMAVAGFLTPLGMIGFSWLADRAHIHLLTADDRDGLRRFDDRRFRLGGRGRVALAGGNDDDVLIVGRVVCGRGLLRICGRGSATRQEQGETERAEN